MLAPDSPHSRATDQVLTVRVRLFAGLREAMGWSERSVIAATGTTPLTLWQELGLAQAWRADHGEASGGARRKQAGGGSPEGPAAAVSAAALPGTIRIAINHRFATAEAALADGDELAFLPPISGG